jgi:aryl-alcohol dehydrogenase-like predicted oxidoreductase
LRYRQLGDSDLQVSEICLGTWTTFGGSLDDDAAIALVDAAFEHGVNFFAIVGSSRPEQLRHNAAASGFDLDDATLRAIEDAM